MTTSASRSVRSKLRIDLLVDGILNILEAYPQLSINAVATAVNWTQSSFQRAIESRDKDNTIPARTGRLSVENLVAEYGMQRDFEAITTLLDAVQAVAQLQETPEEELPGYEPPAPKQPKAKKAKAAADSESTEETEEDFEDDSESTEDDEAFL